MGEEFRREGTRARGHFRTATRACPPVEFASRTRQRGGRVAPQEARGHAVCGRPCGGGQRLQVAVEHDVHQSVDGQRADLRQPQVLRGTAARVPVQQAWVEVGDPAVQGGIQPSAADHNRAASACCADRGGNAQLRGLETFARRH
ncbi:hypothetical protein ACRAWF_02200 [Streptomyces sp. L7]